MVSSACHLGSRCLCARWRTDALWKMPRPWLQPYPNDAVMGALICLHGILAAKSVLGRTGYQLAAALKAGSGHDGSARQQDLILESAMRRRASLHLAAQACPEHMAQAAVLGYRQICPTHSCRHLAAYQESANCLEAC